MANYLNPKDDPVREAFTYARVKMIQDHAFFGTLAVRMDLIDASEWCRTLATDGRKIYYNREFVKSLSVDEILFGLAHEVLHAAYDHLGRSAGLDRQLANMAQDYIVNYTLVKNNIGRMIKGGLYSEDFTDEMTSEQVYTILKERQVEIQMTLDDHLELGEGSGDDNEDGNGNGSGQTITVTVDGDENGPPVLTEEELEEIREDVKTAVMNAAQAAGAGRVPAGIARLIKDLTEPKMDWREYLETYIKSAIKDDYTFTRLSRRSWSTNVILPGMDELEKIDIAVCIDTSGSMTEEMLRDFLSEVKGIMTQFEDFKLRLWTFDTKVYDYKVFTPENVDEIIEYPMSGGGGTDFEVNWSFMADPEVFGFDEESFEPSKLVFFTDGYPCGGWGDENFCDTMFIIHSDDNVEAPFGTTVHYDKETNG